MSDFKQEQTGRTAFFFPPKTGSILNCRRKIICLLLALPGPAFLFSALSCSEITMEWQDPQITHTEAADTVTSEKTVYLEGNITIKGGFETADIFLYREADGLLRSHLKGEDPVFRVSLPPGEYHVAVICNSPYEFNEGALQHLESLELVRFCLRDEDRMHPSRSACSTYSAGQDICIAPETLVCSVTLSAITNCLPDYRLLEDVEFHVEGINDDTEVLRFSGFRPGTSSECSDTVKLDFAIGMFTQYPSKKVFVYPDDGRDVKGADGTMIFVLECTVRGERLKFKCPLNPMGRHSSYGMEACILSESECEWKLLLLDESGNLR